MVGCIPTIPRTIHDHSESWANETVTMEPGGRYANTEFVGSPWVGVTYPKSAEKALEDVAFVNCQFRYGLKWLSRAYRVRQILFDQCEFLDVLHEHGIYHDIAGGMPANDYGSRVGIAISRTAFRNISSQACQFTSPWDPNLGRMEETSDPEGDKRHGLGIKLEDVRAENICAGTGHARAGFCFSFFPTPNDVWMEGVRLDNRMQTKCEGAFMSHKRATPTSRFRMEHCTFRMGKQLVKPIGQLWDTDNVTIQDSEFVANEGQTWIDIDRCARLTLRRCHGNISVHRDGVDMGPIENIDLDESE